MKSRLRILFVAPYLPFPPRVGISIRVFHLVREIARHHDVALLAYGDAAQDAARCDGLRAVGIDVHTVRPPRRIGSPDGDTLPTRARASALRLLQLGIAFMPFTYQGRYLWSRPMQQRLDALVAGRRFDLVQLETSELWRLAVPAGPRVIVDELNIEFMLRRRLARLQHSPFKRFFNLLESVKFEREERSCWRRAAGVLVVSDDDARCVRRLEPAARVSLVPNGIDVERHEHRTPECDAGSLVFVGRMDYSPNVDAVTWFVRDILPRIRAHHPGATFTIVGGPVTPSLARLERDGVRVIGRTADVTPHLARAAVLPVPLRAGGGTRLKILEGMAMSKPIVSTSVGCEGLRATPGEHLLVADTADGFASATARLLHDPALCRQLGRAGRALVERTYDWRIVGAQLESAYAEVV